MATYPKLHALVLKATTKSLERVAAPYLIEVWLAEYFRKTKRADVVETVQSGCSYLFDLEKQRLISAWTISRGAHVGARDNSRMRGHPQGFGSEYHRGHAIPHSAGGPTDINLVPQRGSINVGAFRFLEKLAVATPGSLYFTHWIYSDQSQMPCAVEQGLLRKGWGPSITVHGN